MGNLAGDTSHSWQARPWVARFIRGLVVAGPIVLAGFAALLAHQLVPVPDNSVAAIMRMLAIMALSTATIWGSDRVARRLLPLAVLMQLSLIFPDQAPSRIKAALKGGSSRRLERMVDQTRREGLDRDPGVAARQVVELIGALGDHDRRTRGHSERVRLYAEILGVEMNLTVEERQKLQWGALLHDLGKLMVPPEILNKAGKPSVAEWAVIQKHPNDGMRLIEPLREFLGEWVHAIGGHHERWDGKGYPNSLSGSAIPRAAAIVAVADSYEVMVAVRSYKKPMSASEARAELSRCAGTHFSPEVVRAFLSISIGRLRLIAGPIASLIHVPMVGSAIQLPTALPGIPISISSAIPSAATAVLAATVGIIADAPAMSPWTNRDSQMVFQAAADSPSATIVDEQSSQDSSTTTVVGEDAIKESPESTTTSSTPTSIVPELQQPSDATTTTSVPESTDQPAANEDPGQYSAPPATDSPSASTVDNPASATEPVHHITLLYADNPKRLNPRPLKGAVFSPGTSIYVFSETEGSKVSYKYPGGNNTAFLQPYDMMGRLLLLVPKSYDVPYAKGTYTITATAHGPWPDDTVTASFIVR